MHAGSETEMIAFERRPFFVRFSQKFGCRLHDQLNAVARAQGTACIFDNVLACDTLFADEQASLIYLINSNVDSVVAQFSVVCHRPALHTMFRPAHTRQPKPRHVQQTVDTEFHFGAPVHLRTQQRRSETTRSRGQHLPHAHAEPRPFNAEPRRVEYDAYLL